MTWQQLAAVDGNLTQKWVNSGEMVAHRIVIDVPLPDFVRDVESCLDSEYGKSIRWVKYSPVK